MEIFYFAISYLKKLNIFAWKKIEKRDKNHPSLKIKFNKCQGVIDLNENLIRSQRKAKKNANRMKIRWWNKFKKIKRKWLKLNIGQDI